MEIWSLPLPRKLLGCRGWEGRLTVAPDAGMGREGRSNIDLLTCREVEGMRVRGARESRGRQPGREQ